MLSDIQLKQFKDLYRHYCGVELSDEEAREAAGKLVELLAIIYKPIKEGE